MSRWKENFQISICRETAGRLPPLGMRMFGDTDVELIIDDFGFSSSPYFKFRLERTGSSGMEDDSMTGNCSIEVRRGNQSNRIDLYISRMPFRSRYHSTYFSQMCGDADSKMSLTIKMMFHRNFPAIEPPMTLGQFVAPLFQDQDFKDVVVVCGDKSFYCHKIILAGRSEVFRTMLSSHFKEANESKITIDHFPPDVVESLIKFVYEDEIARKSVTWDLFEAAKLYEIPRLQKLCLKALCSKLNVSTCCQTLLATFVHDLDQVFEMAVTFLLNNENAVTKTEDWKLVADNPKLMATIESRMKQVEFNSNDEK